MATYRNSRLIPTILAIIIAIVAIIALVALARAVFFGSSTSPSQAALDQQALLDTSDGSSVSMTVRGPIVADENFRSYKIEISPNGRNMDTYSGYLNTVLKQENLDNNTAAYEQFVHALDKANMTSARSISDAQNDTRGVCATGKLYEFSTIKNGNAVQTLWTSTCSGSQGSLNANVSQLSQLFQKQIPDANSLLSGLAL